MSDGFWILAQVLTLAYAMVGGVFLAFSDFLMRSMAKSGGASGIQVMQSINREVFRWIFMTLFIGLAPLSLLVAGYALLTAPGPASSAAALAGALYVFGCFAPTAARNVPMNNALAALDPASAEAEAYWRDVYLPRWTFWNSVRAVACVAAAAVMLLAAALG